MLSNPSDTLPRYKGLKKLNDWPTFPQIIVNGELIGGLDILKVSLSTALVAACADCFLFLARRN